MARTGRSLIPATALGFRGLARAWPVWAAVGAAALAWLLSGAPVTTAVDPPPPRWHARAGTEVPVTAADLRVGPANNSPVLAADPTEPRFVALANRIDGPGFGCALHLSGDGGRGWVPARPVPQLPPGAEKCYAPELAFDRGGTLYYLFVGLRGRGNNPMGVFLTTSSDRGRTFSVPRRLLGPGNYQVRLAIDSTVGAYGRLHLAWLHVPGDAPLGGLPPTPNPILTAYSDDAGRTLSVPVQVSDHWRQRVVAPALAVGADRRVHVLYYDLQDDVRDYQGLEGPRWEGRWSLVVASSTDGGRTFGSGVLVDDRVVPPGRVMLIYTMPPATLAADTAGRLYVGWYDGRNGDWDVFVRRSADGGRTWAAPQRMGDDEVGSGYHQYLPRLSVASTGRVDLIFYDRSGDPENVRNDVRYTFSTNGGARFAPGLWLTSQRSDARIGQRYLVPSAKDLVEFGSRLGLLSTDSSAVAAWTDTRNGRPGIQQDVFATTVRVS